MVEDRSCESIYFLATLFGTPIQCNVIQYTISAANSTYKKMMKLVDFAEIVGSDRVVLYFNM